MKTCKVLVSFPPEQISKPITWHLVRDYQLKINILRAEIAANKAGELIMDLEGDEADIERAIAFLCREGIRLYLLGKAVEWEENRCVHCGACTAVCPSGALGLDRKEWRLIYEPARCFVCELCVTACPLRAFSATFRELAPELLVSGFGDV